MNFTVFVNEVIFPCLLFFFFFSVITVAPQSLAINIGSTTVNTENTTTKSLEEFYNLISQNNSIQAELDEICDREHLVNRLIEIGSIYGYRFTTKDINQAINEHTDITQSNYLCLPIGCWRIS